MSTFHATTPGNASDSATWAEHAVPGSTDHWISEVGVHLDSGLSVAELDSGGSIEVQGSTLVLDADVTFAIRAGATLATDSGPCTLDLLGALIIDGGVFSNLGQFESSDNSNAVLGAWGDALLVNPTTFLLDRWMSQTMDDGSGGPTTVRLQYTTWKPPASATYLPPAEILANPANGATIDFATRDSSGVVNDPDFLPTVPVVQTGAITDTIVMLRRNGPSIGSYTATFPTPVADQSYYVPVCWTIGGNAYVQEFRVTVQSIDLPGKVLGGGTSSMVGPGVITANPATQVNVTTENTTIRT
jgi:hypothetical protein